MYIARRVEYDMTGVPIAEIAVAGYATDVAFRRLYLRNDVARVQLKRVVEWMVEHSNVSAHRLSLIDQEPLSPTTSSRLHLVRPRLLMLSQKYPMAHMICLLQLRDPE